ncbi:MAG TPA: glycosyltransferase family 4 protein [Anaerolineae bacterium]|nr:glycosyltransferase family 4 protein [Anaerolineae bacterium]
MKLLFISNYFPPYGHGGYEEWCYEVAHHLREQGDEIIVLTSEQTDVTGGDEPEWVQRKLHLETSLSGTHNAWLFFTQRQQREAANLAELTGLIEGHQPDFVVVWGMWNLSKRLPALAEQIMPNRVVYYIGDYWLTLPNQHRVYWLTPTKNWLGNLPKMLLRRLALYLLSRDEAPPQLQLVHTLFPTAFMQDELASRGFKGQQSAVVAGGVDVTPYQYQEPQLPVEKLNLLYVGRLMADKGVHILIPTLAELVHRYQIPAELVIVGSGGAEYEQRLRELVVEADVASRVVLAGRQEKGALPAFYARADMLLFPTIWEEPFGRVPVEAMANGVVVVGCATGGAADILQHEQTALVVPVDDYEAMAKGIKRLYETPALWRRLVTEAYERVQARFTTKQMARGIRGYLEKVF